MPVICAATGCNNKFVKGSDIRFYRYVSVGCSGVFAATVHSAPSRQLYRRSSIALKHMFFGSVDELKFLLFGISPVGD